MNTATSQRSMIAIALQDFDTSCNDELSFKKKEKLTILDDSNHWWKVKNNDNQIGLVPSDYLKRTDESKSKTRRFKNLFSKNCKNNPPSVEENDHPFYESINDDPDGNTAKTPTEKTEKDDALVSNKVGSDVICKVKTLRRFIPQYGDELPFEAGEILDIIDQPEDNPDWFTARNGNGHVGLIPFNHVNILKPASCNQTSHSQTADNPKEYDYATPYEEAKIGGGRKHAYVEIAGCASPYEEPNIASATNCVENTGCASRYQVPNIAAATNCVGNTDYANVEGVTCPEDNPDEINERHLYKLSKFLARDWKHLGRTLPIKEDTIEAIDEDYHDVREKSYQLLLTWKRTNGWDANAEVLTNALVSIERRDVAGRLASIIAEPSDAGPSKYSYVLFAIPKPDAENPEGYATPYET